MHYTGVVIEIVDHDPRWPSVFEELRALYASALASVPVIAIEHVGSTAVPGLAAKPIIDVDIVVGSNDVDAAIRSMEHLGFRSVGERGIGQRWALLQPPDLPRTNTYVVVEGSLALRNHLGVRDVLRSDQALRDEYAGLKRALADAVDEMADYTQAKTELLAIILERAGLTADERGRIARANIAQANQMP